AISTLTKRVRYGEADSPICPRHPSIFVAGASNGALPRPDSQYAPIIPCSATPTYKPSAIPISATTRAVAQQPTYTTPPSSPTSIAVSTVYAYAGSPYPTDPTRAAPALETAGMSAIPASRFQRTGWQGGVWDRESDVHYLDLCRHEIEEAEERSSSRKGQPPYGTQLKLWLSINPREPQARQQTIDLYSKPRLRSLRLRLSPAQGGLARVSSAGEQAQRYL
ncbi:hypothetical protein M0805_004477, partial [Coniferiporia weirii]